MRKSPETFSKGNQGNKDAKTKEKENIDVMTNEKTPERVWIGERAKYLLDEEGSCLCYTERERGGIEYVRADLLATVRAEEREAAFKEAIEIVKAQSLSDHSLPRSFKWGVVAALESALTENRKGEG